MNSCSGETLAVLGTAIAIQISSGINADEMNILGALFNVIGDQLSLIAATKVSDDSGSNKKENKSSDDSDSNKKQNAV